MRVVLFGAGASFGSEESPAIRPPLGEGPDLFQALEQFARGTWGSLEDPWPGRFRSGRFESVMGDYLAAGNEALELQWAVAEYFYTSFSATAAGAYTELLRALASQIDKYLFATLNYELLLFQAADHAGIGRGRLNVCLPHGNACLCCYGVKLSGRASLSGKASTGGNVRPFRDLSDFRAERKANRLPPVMSYYEPDKFTVSCANYIQEQRQTFCEAILSAERVAIVGVSIIEADEHIWGPLGKTKAPIFYLSGPSAVGDFSKWSARQSRPGDASAPKYFRDGLRDLIGFLG